MSLKSKQSLEKNKFKVTKNGDIFVLNTDVICALYALMVGRKCLICD